MSSTTTIDCQGGEDGFVSHMNNLIDHNDSIQNMVSGLGTGADAAMHGRPTFADRLTDPELDILYVQNDLARRIVDELPEDALRAGWKVTDAESGEELKTPPRHQLHRKLLRAYKMGRLKGFSALIMIPPANVNLALPLRPDEQIASLLLAVGHEELSEWDYETDPRSPYFGECSIYQVNTQQGGGASFHARVHRSRMLIFEGAELPPSIEEINYGFKDSVLQACWPSIRRFTEIEQGMANIVVRFETAVYSISGLPGALASPEGMDAVRRRMALVQQTMSMVNAAVLDSDSGETFTRTYANVGGLDKLWDRFALSASKSAKMPMTQLFGQAAGGMASDDESGKANWRKQVKSAQREHVHPVLEQYYTHLNNGKPVKIVFDSTEEMTALQEADIAVKRATARSLYGQTETVNGSLLTDERFVPMLKEEGVLRADFDAGDAALNREFHARKAGILENKNPQGNFTNKNRTVAANPSGIMNRTDAEADRFNVPEAARENARRALGWKEKYGDEVQGGTAVGWTRARQLANEGWVTRETLGRMSAFNRHRQNSTVDPEFESTPWRDAGHVAWLIWGGDEGVDWAMREMDKLDGIALQGDLTHDL